MDLELEMRVPKIISFHGSKRRGNASVNALHSLPSFNWGKSLGKLFLIIWEESLEIYKGMHQEMHTSGNYKIPPGVEFMLFS